jgi:hypothetical protein
MAAVDAGVKRDAEGGELSDAAKRQMMQPAEPSGAGGRPPSPVGEGGASRAPLPAGWEEFVSARTGKAYWYNATTLQTTWDRPGSAGKNVCKHFTQYGTCKFGDTCKFDHPGGLTPQAGDKTTPANEIPNNKAMTGGLPVRDQTLDCTFFLRTGMCKYGKACKWNHPVDKQSGSDGSLVALPMSNLNNMERNPRGGQQQQPPFNMMGGGYGMPGMMGMGMPGMMGMGMPMGYPGFQAQQQQQNLPSRPDKPDCHHYTQHGSCKFGPECKYNHPPKAGAPDTGRGQDRVRTLDPKGALENNEAMTSGLPVREGVADCTFFGRTGMCRYGKACKWNHPLDQQKGTDGARVKLPPPKVDASPFGPMGMPMPIMGTCVSGGQTYPVRPGGQPCKHYLQHNNCKFGMECRYDHPPGMAGSQDRSGGGGDQNNYAQQNSYAAPMRMDPGPSYAPQMPVNGASENPLPVRYGAEDCPYFLRTGSCRYGATCKFNHPAEKQVGGAPRQDPYGMQQPMGQPMPGAARGMVQQQQPVPQMAPQPAPTPAQSWEVRKTDQGHTFYWNPVTQISQYEVPPELAPRAQPGAAVPQPGYSPAFAAGAPQQQPVAVATAPWNTGAPQQAPQAMQAAPWNMGGAPGGAPAPGGQRQPMPQQPMQPVQQGFAPQGFQQGYAPY